MMQDNVPEWVEQIGEDAKFPIPLSTVEKSVRREKGWCKKRQLEIKRQDPRGTAEWLLEVYSIDNGQARFAAGLNHENGAREINSHASSTNTAINRYDSETYRSTSLPGFHSRLVKLRDGRTAQVVRYDLVKEATDRSKAEARQNNNKKKENV